MPGFRGEEERDQFPSAARYPDHGEWRFLTAIVIAARREEDLAAARLQPAVAAALEVGVFDGGGEVVGDGREQDVPLEERVADGDLGEGVGASQRAVEEEAAVAVVTDEPGAARGREEGEGEVGGEG